MSGSGPPRGSGPHAVPRFVRAGETVLHVRSEGGPGAHGVTLAYVNSLGSDLRIWDGVVARLPGRPHLRHDLRGHGLSDVPPAPYAIADHAADLLAVLDAHGLDRVVLVGISVGGLIALRATLERPEAVAALVLMDTAAKLGDEDGWNARIATVREQGLPAASETIVQRWFPERFRLAQPDAYRGYRNLLARTPAEGYVGTCAALRDEDLRERLHEIAVPALVMGGSEDVSTPPATVRELSVALPDARWHEIDGSGHLPCVDRPDEVADRVDAFLEEVLHAG